MIAHLNLIVQNQNSRKCLLFDGRHWSANQREKKNTKKETTQREREREREREILIRNSRNNDKEGDKEEEVVEVSTMAIRCCNCKPSTFFFFF